MAAPIGAGVANVHPAWGAAWPEVKGPVPRSVVMGFTATVKLRVF